MINPLSKLTSASLKALAANTLTSNELENLATAMLQEELEAEEIRLLLTAFQMKGLPEGTLEAFSKVVRLRANKPFETAEPLIDLCGTGGDGLSTFNISTLSALVVSAAGIKTAKHGNRAQSGHFGSFDLLESLGIPFENLPGGGLARFKAHHLVLLYAPTTHPALKHMSPIRKSLPFPTLFNQLGPLVNPMALTHQVIGVYHPDLMMPMAKVMQANGIIRGFVVCGYGGLDELSLEGINQAIEVTQGHLQHLEIDPKSLPLECADNQALVAETPERALAIAKEVIAGRPGPYQEAVCLNAGLALLAAGAVANLASGIRSARFLLGSSSVAAHVQAMINQPMEVLHVS